MTYFKRLIAVVGLLMLSSCGAYFNQPFEAQPARVGEYSKSTKGLLDLPEAADPVEVAVYNFSDQTGQFKPVENGSTFSTAVTQGATTILIKALEDSGWFVPIERENLSNLTTERNIIRNTKQEYIKNLNPNEPPLPPLLYAGLLLEGGIVSYDTNIVTGGIGARYFGLGGSARYRQDRITVYLRAVSTNSGEILKTIYVSKTILSQSLDANFFRFVKFQRLLEAETGITQSEPIQLAVKDAIEKAVHDLILEGIIEQYWSAKEGKQVNDELVTQYLEDKAVEESSKLHNRLFVEKKYKNNFSFSGGVNLIDGDFSTQRPGFYGSIGYQAQLTNQLDIGINASIFDLDSGEQFSKVASAVDVNLFFDLLPNDDLAPFIYGGSGVVFEVEEPIFEDAIPSDGPLFKIQFGAGVQYKVSPRISLKLFAEQNIVLSDRLDNFENGRRDDFYYNFGFGLNYFFNWNTSGGTKTQL